MAFSFNKAAMAKDDTAAAHCKAYADDLNTIVKTIIAKKLTFKAPDAQGKITLASGNYQKLMDALKGADKTHPKAKAALQVALKAKNDYTTAMKNAK